MVRPVTNRASLCAWCAALLVVLSGAFANLQADSVVLTRSIAPVDTTAPPTGQAPPHGGYITRRTLRADEASASMEFEVALKMPNFADLQARVAKGERISPQEMAAKYEPSAADYAQVTAWLTAQGFTVTRRENTHVAVFARGTISQLQSAMQLTFARVSNGSAEFTSAITAPSVPGTLAPLLVGINGLQPHLRPHAHLIHKNSLTNTSPPYTPAQIAQAYNVTPLYNSSVTGAGQTIAIVIDTFPNNSDLTSFWTACNINQSLSNFTFINTGTVNPLPAADDEVALDTEWTSAIAPAVKVRVYAAGTLAFTDLDAAYSQVYTDATSTPSLNINQMTMSYGIGEQYEGGSQLDTDDELFVMLAGAGVGLFASSGDDGATPNSSGSGGNGIEEPEAPSSDPNVTAVGGTSLTLTSSGSENTEVVWNDPSGATGGGLSQFFSRPNWQSGTGVPSGNARCVPDVAAPADPDNGAFYVFNGSQSEVGGTSWSSPTWAAFCALINQSRANAGLKPTGQLAPLLYKYIGTANFRDITSGNNKFQSRHGYSAGTGYDLCTGIGVPNLQNLAATLTPIAAPLFTDGPATATGEVGVAYSFTYTASGSPTATFTLVSGSQLPNNLTLTSTGTLSGTPTQSGVFTGTVTAGNGVNPSATQAYSLTIDQAPAFTDGPPTATTNVNTVYSFTYTASGYPAPTFLVTEGGLPTGLSLSPAGAITGTTTLGGSFTGTVTASNTVNPDALQGFTIVVDQPPAYTSSAISTTISTNTTDAFTLTASGYPSPTFTITSGNLPTGLMLATNGVISGSPSATGTFTGVITASNNIGDAATQNFTITVEVGTDTPTLPPAALAILAALLALVASRHLGPRRVT